MGKAVEVRWRGSVWRTGSSSGEGGLCGAGEEGRELAGEEWIECGGEGAIVSNCVVVVVVW